MLPRQDVAQVLTSLPRLYDGTLLQLPDLFHQRRLLLLERLDLVLQLRSLVSFKNSGSDGGDERRSNDGFLQRGHGDGLGCGNYG